METGNDLIHFRDDGPDATRRAPGAAPWKVLIVDDDVDVHRAMAFALGGLSILGRPLALLSAYSGAEALGVLGREPNVAVILLDVVMETPTAGLDIIAAIRHDLGLTTLRILLCTGQPGYAPEIETVQRYDINDYKTKSELTRTRLFVALFAALRTYDQICRLDDFAHTDGLTGLPNRTALLERLSRCDPGRDCDDRVLALLDIDQFSAINDMFGHDYGDRLLRAVAQRLAAAPADGGFVARIGNDTFAVFGARAGASPEALRPLLRLPLQLDGIEHALSISIGAVRLADRTPGASTGALNDAWLALKRAKLGGQGRDAWFTAVAGQETRAHAHLLHALQEAFRLDRLFLVYQPQIDLGDGHVVGVEALLRWRGEDGQYISPERFIPVAENSGLIVDLGAWVMRTALQAAERLREAGWRGIAMAVNVSASQLAHHGFLDTLDAALADRACPPQDFELEITETAALLGADAVERLLHAIKQRGVSIAIDDFGTGYSSLSYLDRLPADLIKIDRSFVSALHAGERGARIAEMVIPLGRQLGMTVLAEGVETPGQAERLIQLGCSAAQGYLYARPMPLAELIAWLAARQPGSDPATR